MRIAIVTLTRNPNYGNILQNIALTNFLTDMGAEVETIFNGLHSSLKPDTSIKSCIKYIIKKEFRTLEKKRRNFIRVTKRYIKYSKYRYNGSINSRVDAVYDYFIVGSDQVWNPYFGFGTEYEFLDFASKGKRFSYAASIGVDKIDESFRGKMGYYLKQMDKISVREESGAKIVKTLIGNLPEVHIDPTMLLTVDKWKEIMEVPRLKPQEPYILVYMLGNIPEEYMQVIRNIARGKNIIFLNNSISKEYIDINPLEFLWLVNNADFICTDSFHGTVFSILFETQFLVFNRKDSQRNQFDRIITLLNKFDLDDCIFMKSEEIKYGVSFENCRRILELEREKSLNYLYKCMPELAKI